MAMAMAMVIAHALKRDMPSTLVNGVDHAYGSVYEHLLHEFLMKVPKAERSRPPRN
jgi:hypothetical protein